MQQQELKIANWRIPLGGAPLGYGMGAVVVRRAYDGDSNVVSAAKIIPKSQLEESEREAVIHEAEVLRRFDHPHIIKLLDFQEDENNYVLFLEYCGGDLHSYLEGKESLSESEARSIFKQILDAVSYLHSTGYAHRDLKLENILLESQKKGVKLGDFGCCVKKLPEKISQKCGSPHYASPEMIEAHPYDPEKVDVWSLGVILYSLVCGNLPFTVESDYLDDMLEMIRFTPVYLPSRLSSDLKHLLDGMLNKNADERLSIRSIMEHPWLHPSPQPPPLKKAGSGRSLLHSRPLTSLLSASQ